MKNNKGFTLVELLAMLVVLGILMAVAVPNITGIMSNQKTSMYKSDAMQMVESAKTKVAKNKYIQKPAQGECLVFSLNYLNSNEDFSTGPNGGEYLPWDSYVVYAREGSRYKYYVTLIEPDDSVNYGYYLADIDEIKEHSELLHKMDGDEIWGLTQDTEASLTLATEKLNGRCTVVKYY